MATWSKNNLRLIKEGPTWDGGAYEDLIAEPNTAYARHDAQVAQQNLNQNTSVSSSSRRPQTELGFAASRQNQGNQGNQGNQSGGITPEQYSQHAYQVIMGIIQDAVDQGVIDAGSISQLAGQAFATWVAGGPSALINFLNQNNIPFEAN